MANLLDRRRGKEESNQKLIRFNQLLSFGGLKYSYDEYGRTLSKQTTSGTQYYHYDAEYRLTDIGIEQLEHTERYGYAGKRQSLYLYTGEGSYEPLALIDRNGNQEQRIYYFHTDLNGMPEELTDEAGEIVWECSYQLWGNRYRRLPIERYNRI